MTGELGQGTSRALLGCVSYFWGGGDKSRGMGEGKKGHYAVVTMAMGGGRELFLLGESSEL